MQGAQTESRFRGIGRYSLSLALALTRAAEKHEVILALNGLLPESIEPIRSAFAELLPRENVRVWNALGPTRELEATNATRRAIAERAREAFLLSLNPDVVLVTSLFEGLGDDAIISIGTLESQLPTAVILYDLIPLISPDIHFRSSPLRQEYYARKIEYLKRSKHLLAISESARNEALGALAFSSDQITNISGACDTSFKKITLEDHERKAVHKRFGISGDFLLYTGGADERKNLARLVSAYAQLPAGIRHQHQLVMAGHMPPGEVDALQKRAAQSELDTHELIFTGYISDAELLALYNSCKLFVFPSTHEGFGIPPLEAMSCGAAVIGANSTSLPEVIGLAEAMFDPESVESIRDKMLQALTDEKFREVLLRNGAAQSEMFSWEQSARKAWQALKQFDAQASKGRTTLARIEQTSLFKQGKKRILVLKLDHLGDLILATPAIAKLKARYPDSIIDIAVGSWNVALAKMFPFFEKIHVLDYFKKKSSGEAMIENAELQAFFSKLDNYDIALDLRRQGDTRFVLQGVNSALKVGYRSFNEQADRALDIVLDAAPDVPFVETPLNRTSITQQMLALIDALPQEPGDFLSPPRLFEQVERKKGAVAVFPYAGNDVKEWDVTRYQALIAILSAEDSVSEINMFFASTAEAERNIFAGSPKIATHAGLGIPELMETLAGNSVCIANNSGGAHLASSLGLTVIGVYGGHETAAEWAPVFPNSYVIHRDADCSPCHIAHRSDCKYQFHCLEDISVQDVHEAVMEAVVGTPVTVSKVTLTPKAVTKQLVVALTPFLKELPDEEIARIASCVASNIQPANAKRKLFIDISELVQRDSKTGIQRVTRSILKELFENSPLDYEVVPVYASMDRDGYFTAKRFLDSFFSRRDDRGDDDLVEFFAGDVFLGLDLQAQVVLSQKKTLDAMHRSGVKILFVVYDLLCVQMPNYFAAGASSLFGQWLDAITSYDGALCISRAVADDLGNYMGIHHPERKNLFHIDWFHIAADIANSSPTRGLPPDSAQVLQRIQSRPTFLSVGTIEPRKGYAQTLDAFELLWDQGCDVNLTIVGKQGWLVDALAERLRRHKEAGKHLFWLESISDEYLESIYGISTCLIAASEGEGFGLPLIEAARHKVAILARNLPVFQEVAGPHASYFDGLSPAALAEAVTSWLALFKQQSHPKSEAMPWLTWRQTTQDLLKLVRSSDNCHRPSLASHPVSISNPSKS